MVLVTFLLVEGLSSSIFIIDLNFDLNLSVSPSRDRTNFKTTGCFESSNLALLFFLSFCSIECFLVTLYFSSLKSLKLIKTILQNYIVMEVINIIIMKVHRLNSNIYSEF